MLIISKDIANIKATKGMLASKFHKKILGFADVILGLKILKTPNGLTLFQIHYIQKVLENFKDLNFKRSKTPIDVNLHLAKNKGEIQSQLYYANVLGSLMYVMNCTQLDIACTISKLSGYTIDPN